MDFKQYQNAIYPNKNKNIPPWASGEAREVVFNIKELNWRKKEVKFLETEIIDK